METDGQKSESNKKGLLSMNRRNFLKMTGLAAGTALMPLKSLIGGKSTGKVIQQAKAQSDSQNSEDYTIFGNKVTGIVENEEHQFKLGGNIKNIYVEDGATVKVNGKEVTEQELSQLTEQNCIIGSKSEAGGSDQNNETQTDTHSHDIPDEGPVTIHGITFQNVVNAGEVMDSTGGSAVDGDMVFDNDTLIKFPPGTYKFTEEHTLHDLENWGMIGTGGSREDVKLITNEGERLDFLNIRSGKNILLENFTFDQGDEKEGAIGNGIIVQDNLQIRQLKHAGWVPDEARGGTKMLNVLVEENPDGEALIQDYDARFTGGTNAKYPGNNLCVWSGPSHVGKLTFRNVKMQYETGFYTSRTEGEVYFENCWFKNIIGEAIRVAGEGTYIKDCTFIMDSEDANIEGRLDEMFMIPIRWESGFQGRSGGYVENCDIVARNSWDGSNTTLISIEGDAGGMEMRDIRITCESENTNIITAEAPGETGSIDGTPDEPWAVKISNLTVKDSGTSGWYPEDDEPVIKIEKRPESMIEDSCIQSENRDGIKFMRSDNCSISNTTINVPGNNIIEQDSTVSESNLSQSGTCQGSDL